MKREPSKKILLAYFSGTGCTKAVCECFEEQWKKYGYEVCTLNMADNKMVDMKNIGMLFVLSPVYAFRLTTIAETWVEHLPKVGKTPAVIISVSGGGDVSPNTACRDKCKSILQRKGYVVRYESMIVMPSNFATQASHELNMALLQELPNKVNRIVIDVMSGKRKVLKAMPQDKVLAFLGQGEHLGARVFGACIQVSSSCNQCGLCVKNCPQKNIRMDYRKPKFGFRCMFCLKCIYACPTKALSPGILKFAVLKNGFHLEKMVQQSKQATNYKHITPKHSVGWQGVIDYLSK